MTVDEFKKTVGLEDVSDYALAKRLKRTRQRVSQWRKRGFVPKELQAQAPTLELKRAN